MSATLAEIATHAGVSPATVSRVLNDKPGVAPDTRRAVLTSLDVLGYDRPARLRARTARPVGLLVPELGDPAVSAFAQALASNLPRRGFTPLLGVQGQHGAREDEVIDMFLEAGATGILFVGGRHADTTAPTGRYRELRAQGMPLGFVNGYREGIDAPFFSFDYGTAASLAVRHLASLGHRRIGFAAGPATLVSTVRTAEGFARGLHEMVGPDAVPVVAHTQNSDDGGASAARLLIEEECTAIVCGSDLIALGVLAEARRQEIAVGVRLSVMSLDDSLLARSSWPPLTTLRQPFGAMGVAIVDAFVGEMNGIPASRAEYIFQPELIVRESTGRAPA